MEKIHKLSPRWRGPYKVVKIPNSFQVVYEDQRREKITHISNCKKFHEKLVRVGEEAPPLVTQYFVQDAQRHLFFSKVKASLLRERTLPTLELLAVQLALKCFLTIFNNGLMKDVSFSDINFFIDSQVVLSREECVCK